jgi:phosphopantetheinyl transferase
LQSNRGFGSAVFIRLVFPNLHFASRCEIGVGVEMIGQLPKLSDIARRCFCRQEAAELISLSSNQRELGFFLAWMRKEAYVKAIGDGLFAPLKSVRVTLQPGDLQFFSMSRTLMMPTTRGHCAI